MIKIAFTWVLLVGALGALATLLYSIKLDSEKHAACECPESEDPSFIWYPVRWGLVSLMGLVALAQVQALTGTFQAYNLNYLVEFAAVALGWTYALTLLNPKWSITWLIEEFKRDYAKATKSRV